MKSFRVWLLVLLAFALPLRGAMAAAMPCAPASSHVHASAPGADDHHAAPAHAESSAHAVHDHAVRDHAATADHDAADKCGFCASCCSVTAPMAAVLPLSQAPPAATKFPEPRAPAAEFFSGGQERPPRST